MRSCGIGLESTLMWPLPLIHNAGQVYSLIPTACAGVTSVLMKKPDVAQMLDLIDQHRVTHALSIGPIVPQLLRSSAC
jgi:acyl-CoA synthetase (AMP-forming)/AMP-acid ligase II